MEIREFAQRVLLADTLEGKLSAPSGQLTDHDPGQGVAGLMSPGRPAGLHFSEKGVRARLPRMEELHQPEARAVLLHAFANHELLAVELMALALLKFPAAPASFRRGLVHTLKEEQQHTKLYMERMAHGGLALGDLPVNGFFWKSISGMATPLEYVSHLSLTFEQANLDYARHYAGLFHQIGDTVTGQLLDRIYQDEIAHVGYGLKWFRRWKDPARPDWEAWQDTMAFPLSPARAKGNAPFNHEGRRLAGFGGEFIASLDLYAHSRGRTPWVGVFNPAAEACALMRDPGGGQDTATRALARDLDILPIFSLHAEDVVMVRQAPSPAHLLRLREAGVELPQFEIRQENGGLAADSSLRNRKLGRLRPWAWSADTAALLNPLVCNAGEALYAGIPWDENVRSLYAKTIACQAAQKLAIELNLPDETWGTVASNVLEVQQMLAGLLEKGYPRAGLKAPFGMAGRGLMQVQTKGLSERDLTWLRPILSQQEAVVVEPWLERVADFSCQYELVPGRLPAWRGQTHLINDAGGRFLACEAGPSFTRLLPPEAARCLHGVDAGRIYTEAIPALLAGYPGMERLQGNLGVDAFVYRDLSGNVRLRPLVEINPRTTMGRVTLDLRRLVDPSKTSRLRILHRRAVQGQGFASLAAYAAHWQEIAPLVREPTSSGLRLTSGCLILNDASAAEAFLAILTIGPHAN